MAQRSGQVTRTVVLAAGTGTRLGGGDVVPKPLMRVGGLPLIAHALAHAVAAGCRDAVVVIGHAGDQVQQAVEALGLPLQIRFASTPDATLPNGHSLLAAAPWAGARFFLQMVDHLFASVVLTRLVERPLGDDEAGRVLVDRAPTDLDLSDATRVRLDGARVLAIGKHLEPWDAIDAGCFVLSARVFDALRAVPRKEPLTVSAGMRQLVADRALGAVDVEGVRWVDVDTPADAAIAERLLATTIGTPPGRVQVL